MMEIINTINKTLITEKDFFLSSGEFSLVLSFNCTIDNILVLRSISRMSMITLPMIHALNYPIKVSVYRCRHTNSLVFADQKDSF